MFPLTLFVGLIPFRAHFTVATSVSIFYVFAACICATVDYEQVWEWRGSITFLFMHEQLWMCTLMGMSVCLCGQGPYLFMNTFIYI